MTPNNSQLWQTPWFLIMRFNFFKRMIKFQAPKDNTFYKWIYKCSSYYKMDQVHHDFVTSFLNLPTRNIFFLLRWPLLFRGQRDKCLTTWKGRKEICLRRNWKWKERPKGRSKNKGVDWKVWHPCRRCFGRCVTEWKCLLGLSGKQKL